MVALFITPFFIVFLIYVFIKINAYFKTLTIINPKILSYFFSFVLFGGVFSIFSGFLIPESNNEIKRFFTRIGFYWLGIFMYFIVGLGICLLARLFIKLLLKNKYNLLKAKHITSIIVLVFTVIMSSYGIINAHHLHVTNYEIKINKNSKFDELNIVMIADTHLGYNISLKQVEDMVDKINKLDADIVLFIGDIFDNNYMAIDQPDKMIELFRNIESKYGTYAVWGNHDIAEKIFVGFTFEDGQDHQADDMMLKFIKEARINILYDEWLEIEDVLIYGRPDRQKINLGNQYRKNVDEFMKNVDHNKTIIIMDHQPSDTKQMIEHNVDLYLNGHTHNGQVWPGTILIHFFWDNPYGLKQYGDLYNIVTSGVGLFGVNMRTDCIAEICNIKVKFD